jgi:DNA-binding transcriptional ArsR family regulator
MAHGSNAIFESSNPQLAVPTQHGPRHLVVRRRRSLDGRTQTIYRSTMELNEADSRFDDTFTALAHPARRAILERVMQADLRVTELAKPFDMSLNAVSKHIRFLERAGLVNRRKVWREHIVSFNPKPLEEASMWIEKTRTFWTASLDALDDFLKAEDAAAGRSKTKGKPK